MFCFQFQSNLNSCTKCIEIKSNHDPEHTAEQGKPLSPFSSKRDMFLQPFSSYSQCLLTSLLCKYKGRKYNPTVGEKKSTSIHQYSARLLYGALRILQTIYLQHTRLPQPFSQCTSPSCPVHNVFQFLDVAAHTDCIKVK